MLKEESLLLELWGVVVNTVVYLLNRPPTRRTLGTIPYYLWTRHEPNLDNLRACGYLDHVKKTSTHLKKLKDRIQPTICIGYEIGTKSYRCNHLLTRKTPYSKKKPARIGTFLCMEVKEVSLSLRLLMI